MKVSKIGLENTYQINQIKPKSTERKQNSQVQADKKVKEEISLSIKDEIRRYKEIIKDIPEVREERVKELKGLIEQGRYKVDAKEVGNSILKEIILGAR